MYYALTKIDMLITPYTSTGGNPFYLKQRFKVSLLQLHKLEKTSCQINLFVTLVEYRANILLVNIFQALSGFSFRLIHGCNNFIVEPSFIVSFNV